MHGKLSCYFRHHKMDKYIKYSIFKIEKYKGIILFHYLNNISLISHILCKFLFLSMQDNSPNIYNTSYLMFKDNSFLDKKDI